jgi:hypothetical protein
MSIAGVCGMVSWIGFDLGWMDMFGYEVWSVVECGGACDKGLSWKGGCEMR